MVDPIGCSEAKEEIARCFLTLPADIQAHSIRVAHTAGKSVHHPSFIVGLYHDLPEDTGIPMSVFYSVLTPSECAALFRVSRHWPFKHHRRRTYMDYINELAPCEIAWTVKMADLQDHVSPNRIDHIPKSQVDRYVTAIAYLREHNPKGVE